MVNVSNRHVIVLLLCLMLLLIVVAALPVSSQGEVTKDSCIVSEKGLSDVSVCTTSANEHIAVDYIDLASAGPLTHIYAGQDASVQVAHQLDGNVLEFFPEDTKPGDAGTLVVVDGTLFGPDFEQHGVSATGALTDITSFTFVSQTDVQGSGTVNDPFEVITIVDAGNTGVRLIQADTYVVESEAYRTDIQISNSSDSIKDIILYRAVDCYLGTSDFGYGMVDSVVGSVACTKNPNNNPSGRILQFVPLTNGSQYYQAYYNEIWSWINSKSPFPNTCRCTENIDNGMGLSWRLNLPPSGQVQHSHMTTFSPLGALPLTLQKSADSAESQPRARNGYTITIDNPNQIAVNVVGIVDSLPPGFSYVGGSTSGATTVDPSVNGRDLTWNRSFEVPAAGSLSLHFNVTVSDTPGQYTNDVQATAVGYAVSSALGVAPITVSIEVAPISVDFQLIRDAYSFANGFGPTLWDYTQSDMVLMFGAEDTCAASVSSGSVCLLKLSAIQWHARITGRLNQLPAAGRCDGMTTSALRFFTGIDEPSKFQTGAQNTFALNQGSARQNISWHHVLQWVPNIRQERTEIAPNDALQRIYQALQRGHLQLVNLAFYGPLGEGGHSVLPYAIEDAGNGTWRVLVYDNNSPFDSNSPDESHRFFLFDTNANTYTTNLVGPMGNWTGSATNLRIVVTPLTVFLQRPQCPWCDDVARNSIASPNTLISNGMEELLITDSNGRRLGFIDGQLVNEIPNALAAPEINGLGTGGEPTYFLPFSQAYTIDMHGHGIESDEENAISLFGSGFAASALDIPLNEDVIDKMMVVMDGTEIMFEAGTKKEIHLALTGGEAENEEYEIVEADIGGGNRVALSRNYTEETVIINYQDADAGKYTLMLNKVTDQGETVFMHEGIQIDSGDSHVVLLDSWAPDSVEVCVDEIGNGSYVECETLENQAEPIGHAIYLPIVLTPPDQLAFVSDIHQSEDIYLIDTNGANLIRLTDNPTRDWAPAWSSDGKRIAFSSDRDGDMEIFVMNYDGSNVKQITHNTRFDCCAKWSPDNTQLVFNANGVAGSQDIYVMNADGSGIVNLTNHPSEDWAPDWSPLGDKIAFHSERTGTREIYTMNVDGTDLKNLTNHPGQDRSPNWSPDGKHIAFYSDRDGNNEIYIMEADGSNPTNLTNHPGGDYWGSWSADGTQLTFTTYRHGLPEIYIMNADGSAQKRVTNNQFTDTGSKWRP